MKEMRTMRFKRTLVAVTSTAALALAVGISPAAADNPPFTINPNATGSPTTLGVTGYSNFTANQMNGLSNALIQQTGLTTQTETGTLELSSFSNGIVPLSTGKTGLSPEDNSGIGVANTYGIYALYNVNVSGLSGFGPNQTGTVTGGSFTFYGDIGGNDIFTAASTTATGGSAPTVADTGTNDVVIATGAAVGGTVGTNGSGSPNFTAFANFILCDG